MAASPAALAASRAASIAAGERWRSGAEMRALAARFADCPLDDASPAVARAELLLADAGWAEGLLAPLVAALAEDPLFEPPLRVHRDAVRTGAVLFDCPAVSIVAVITDAVALAALPPVTGVVMPGRVTVTRYVRSGGATLRRWRAEPGSNRCAGLPPLFPADGGVLVCDGRVEAQTAVGAMRDLVSLTVTVRAGGNPLLREFRLPDGTLIRTGSADEGASRTEMLLAYLRAAGRTDAGFAAVTRDPAFHLRWAAMREWLMADAGAALPRLTEMAANDPHLDVRAAAGATLARIEARACRV